MQAMMDLVDEHRRANGATALLMTKPQGGSGECFEFTRKGTCRFGSSCRFAHQGGGPAAPSPYPMSPERRRPNASPQKGDRDQGKGEMCGHFARTGICRFGSACRYEHGTTGCNPYQEPLFLLEPIRERNEIFPFPLHHCCYSGHFIAHQRPQML